MSRDELSRTLRHAAPLMVVGVLYVWLVGMFQYLIPTMLATSAVLAAFGNRGWRRLVVVPLVSAALFHAVFFGLLGLYEAPGSVWEYDGRALFGWLAALFG